MPATREAEEVLQRDFLLMRAKILEIGAMLDRIDRADGSVGQDARLDQIAQAIDVLQEDGDDRAKRIQLIFSRRYEADWKKKFGVKQ